MRDLFALTDKKRAFALSATIVLQAVSAAFFLGDVVADVRKFGYLSDVHLVLELVAALALVAGVVFLMIELRLLLQRMARMGDGLRAAGGEMAELIDAFFASWGLTPSERDVALLILKGCENDQIAALRGTASGTVRAQCTRVYAKAGVEGRAQLFSVFMEELLAVERVFPRPDRPADTQADAPARQPPEV